MLNCLFCKSDKYKKNGQLPSGGQRYKCKDCNKQFSLGGARNTYGKDFRKKVIELYCHSSKTAQEIVKKFGISTRTLIDRSKKHKKKCSKCKPTQQQ